MDWGAVDNDRRVFAMDPTDRKTYRVRRDPKAVLVDFKRAFDKVWRYGLYCKMLRLGIDPVVRDFEGRARDPGLYDSSEESIPGWEQDLVWEEWQ